MNRQEQGISTRRNFKELLLQAQNLPHSSFSPPARSIQFESIVALKWIEIRFVSEVGITLNMRSLVLCFVAFLAICVNASFAIKCHTCNSHFDKGCEKPVGLEKYLKDCDMSPDGLKYTVCRKIDQDLPNHDGVENKIRTIRECGADDPATNTCYQKAGFGGRQYVCACDHDGCNSGTNLKIALATVTSFAASVLMGSRFLL